MRKAFIVSRPNLHLVRAGILIWFLLLNLLLMFPAIRNSFHVLLPTASNIRYNIL